MEKKTKTYCIDINIKLAIDLWIRKHIEPGTFTELLLRGKYDEAYTHAHPLLKMYFFDHVNFVEDVVPDFCKFENFDKWKNDK